MTLTFRGWVAVLLMAVLPAKAALAVSGLRCAMDAAANHSMFAAHHPQPSALHDRHDSSHADAGDVPHTLDAHASYAACAPGSGSLAPPADSPAGANPAQVHGADFLPILVLIRPRIVDALERPPRPI